MLPKVHRRQRQLPARLVRYSPLIIMAHPMLWHVSHTHVEVPCTENRESKEQARSCVLASTCRRACPSVARRALPNLQAGLLRTSAARPALALFCAALNCLARWYVATPRFRRFESLCHVPCPVGVLGHTRVDGADGTVPKYPLFVLFSVFVFRPSINPSSFDRFYQYLSLFPKCFLTPRI